MVRGVNIRWGVVAAFILFSVAISILGNTWLNLISILLFPFAAGWAFRTARTFLVPYFILAVSVFLTDVVSVTVYQMLWAWGILYLNSAELAYMLLVAVTRMMEFMVILLITMAAGKKAGRHITLRQVVLSVFLPMFSMFNMYYTLYMMQIYMVLDVVVLFVVNLILLIGLNQIGRAHV